MDNSPIKSPRNGTSSNPIEIVSDDEMALIDAAFIATRSCISPSAITAAAAASAGRKLSVCSKGHRNAADIEELGGLRRTKKKIEFPEMFLDRFRRNIGLSVTDLASTVRSSDLNLVFSFLILNNRSGVKSKWSFFLKFGKERITKPMKAGKARHAELEQEETEKLKNPIVTNEDSWAMKFMNFIISANQLSTKGLTREVPIVGLVKDVWVIGKIDEVRMLAVENTRRTSLIDTKTRSQSTVPSEPQKRKGRFQLMCYKYLWDNTAANEFPTSHFFSYFGLNPSYTLSEEIQGRATSLGFSAKTLEDLVMHFQSTRSKLLPAIDELLLRYESQEDNSLLSEEYFTYDSEWLMSQIVNILEFWLGKREARYVSPEESWKCRYCQFESICPSTTIFAIDPAREKSTNAALRKNQ